MKIAGQFYCVECGHRADADGMCPSCPDEPLLNLGDELTWTYFEEEYDRAKLRRFGQAVAICLLPGVILMWGLSFVGIGFLIGIPAAAAATAGLASVIAKTFPPKQLAPSLTEQEVHALRAP